MPWTGSRTVTFDHTKVPSDQTNFIAVVTGTYTFLKSTGNGGEVQSASGFDIVFAADAAGVTILNFERVLWDPTTGAVEFWVKVPSLFSAIDTVIYILSGNAAIVSDQANPGATWSGYSLVYHLPDGSSLSAGDSTSNANNGTITNATAISGEVDGAANFPNSVDSQIDAGSGASLDNLVQSPPISFSFWLNLNSVRALNDRNTILGKLTSGTDGVGWLISNGESNDATINFYVFNNAGPFLVSFWNTNNPITLHVWTHIAIVYIGGQAIGDVQIYVNGVSQSLFFVTSGGVNLSDAALPLQIGGNTNTPGAASRLDGSLDEIHITPQNLSNDWFTTEFNNQSSPSTFYAIGSGPVGPSISCPVTNTGTVSVPFTATIGASGGTVPYTFSIVGGSLPPGLSLDASTGVISGTPTTPGTYPYTARVTDANSLTADANCSITISAFTATLTLVKSVSGGSAAAGSFTLSASGPTSISGAGGVGPSTITPGTYTFTETSVANYTLSLSASGGTLVGNQITIGPGDNVTVTFTNTFSCPVSDVQLTTIGGDQTAWGAQLPRLGPYVVGGKVFFMVVNLAANTPGSGFQVNVNWSSDQGTTWNSIGPFGPTQMGSGIISVIGCTFAPQIYNGRIYGLFFTRTGGNPSDTGLAVFYFDLSSSTVAGWSPLPSQPSLTQPVDGSSVTLTPSNGCDISVDTTTGNITIAYGWGNENLPCAKNPGTFATNRRAQYSDYSGGAWGAQTDIPGQSGIWGDFFVSQIIRGSGLLHVMLSLTPKDPATCGYILINDYAYHISRGSSVGGGWGTLQLLATNLPYQGIYNTFPMGLGVVSGGNVIVPYMTGSSNPGQGLGPGISGMSLNAFFGADVINPSWSIQVIDSTISSGNDNLIPGFNPPGMEEATSSVVVDPITGAVVVYYVVTTAAVATNRPLAGDVRKSILSGTTWGAFSTYRSFDASGDCGVPTGVYGYSSTAAIYFLINPSGAVASQTVQRHFLGAPILPPPNVLPPSGGGGRGFIKVTLNFFNACLGREYLLYKEIDRELLKCGVKPHCFCIDERDWGGNFSEHEEVPMGPPEGAIAFNPTGQIHLPTPASGDNTIFTFRVPWGYDGVILGQSHGYYGVVSSPPVPGNFVEGSGDIIWRLSIASRFGRDCGQMLVSLGSIRNMSPIAGGLQIRSENVIQYIVAAPNTSGALTPGLGDIVAGIHGWMWPRK